MARHAAEARQAAMVEKRACFLERVAAELGRVRRPGDQDVNQAARGAARPAAHARGVRRGDARANL